jgi:hypothetical protein
LRKLGQLGKLDYNYIIQLLMLVFTADEILFRLVADTTVSKFTKYREQALGSFVKAISCE